MRPPPRVRSGRRAPPAGPDVARLLRFATALLIAVGVALRLLQYAAPRSLWLDEALLASSVLRRGFAGLLQPLDYAQGAPAGFLMLQKAAVTLLGAGEHALRLVPLLAGLAAVLLYPRVARRFVSPPAAVVALAVVALAPFLVYYSAEAKQYSLDALVAVLVLGVAADLRVGRRAVAAAVVGAVGVWLSQPAVFLLAAAGLALFVPAVRRRDMGRVRLLAAVGAAWIVSFAFSYAASRNALKDPAYMHDFWRAGFAPFDARAVFWLPERIVRLVREPFGVMGDDPFPVLGALQVAGALVLLWFGGAWLVRRHRSRAAILLLPLGLVLIASIARLYPFGADYLTSGRVLIFLIPSLALVMGEGAFRLVRHAPQARRIGAGAAVVALLLPSVLYGAVGVPQMRTEIQPLLFHAARNREAGDLLYVYYQARSPFEYYAVRTGWTRDAVVGSCPQRDPAGPLPELDLLRGRPRVWVLLTDDADGHDEPRRMLEFLDHAGKRLDERFAVGATLVLYDLRPENLKPGTLNVQPIAYDSVLACRGPWGAR